MSITRVGAALTEAQRLQQLGVRAATIRDILTVFPTWNPSDPKSYDRFANLVGGLTQRRYRDSALLADRYYRAFRGAEIGGTFATDGLMQKVMGMFNPDAVRTSIDVTGKATYFRALGEGATRAQASARAVTTLAGSQGRHALNGGRNMMQSAIDSDDQARGWTRITDGDPCPFCAMLASRGPVYKEETVGFHAHDHCGCQAEPVFEGAEWPESARHYHELWQQAKGARTGDTFTEFKRLMKIDGGIKPIELPDLGPLTTRDWSTILKGDWTMADARGGKIPGLGFTDDGLYMARYDALTDTMMVDRRLWQLDTKAARMRQVADAISDAAERRIFERYSEELRYHLIGTGKLPMGYAGEINAWTELTNRSYLGLSERIRMILRDEDWFKSIMASGGTDAYTLGEQKLYKKLREMLDKEGFRGVGGQAVTQAERLAAQRAAALERSAARAAERAGTPTTQFAERVRAAQNAADLNTTGGLRQVGVVVREEIEKRAAAAGIDQKALHLLNKKYDDAVARMKVLETQKGEAYKAWRAKFDEEAKRIGKLADEKFGTEASMINSSQRIERYQWVQEQMKVFGTQMDDPIYAALSQEYDDIVKDMIKYNKERKLLAQEIAEKLTPIKREVIQEIRDLGAPELRVNVTRGKPPANVLAAVDEASSYYPTEWWEGQMNLHLDYRRGRRASMGYNGNINLGDNSLPTAIHELGHHMEHHVDALSAARKLMYEERTVGEKLRWLGPGYGRSEKYRPDQFPDPYMGKEYTHPKSSEVISMASEMFWKPTRGYSFRPQQDDWLLDWFLGVLTSL